MGFIMGENGNGFMKFFIIIGVAFLILFSSALIGTFAYIFIFDIQGEASEEANKDIIFDPNINQTEINQTIITPLNFPEPEDSRPLQLPPSTPPPASFNSPDSYIRTYSWTYDGYSQSFTLTIPKEHYEYYRNKPHSGKSFDKYALSEHDRQLLNEMINGFVEQGDKNGFTEDQNVLNVIAFVQAMPYTSDNVTTGYDEYPRYPIETLVDGGGDCEDSAILAAALLTEMGYGTILLGLPSHMALGVKGSEEISGTYYMHDGSRYYYVETTSSGYGIGEIPREYETSQAQIYTMNPTPVIYATLRTDLIDSDRNYVYYKIRCDFTNKGPRIAKNVNVNIFAEASPYDMTQIWPPEHEIYIGDVNDDGSGWAEATVKIPRNNYTCFSCIIYGDNFNYVEMHTNIVYIN